ncbi:hypothetical protein G5V57_05235 [Nordella sp. HKS 07]|uniref:hypothetical protein n=1 Tax=Nordella sp. HKS 07 TaxID=2712222 RepID=UPI0013E11DC9|nr:hypothetical protein [Nordella sp. HKS 07]QIG47189.1 hypothetical protein G5V57_05235 [Nordella sp. HKS 07]
MAIEQEKGQTEAAIVIGADGILAPRDVRSFPNPSNLVMGGNTCWHIITKGFDQPVTEGVGHFNDLSPIGGNFFPFAPFTHLASFAFPSILAYRTIRVR